jgi:hypothetical protein
MSKAAKPPKITLRLMKATQTAKMSVPKNSSLQIFLFLTQSNRVKC